MVRNVSTKIEPRRGPPRDCVCQLGIGFTCIYFWTKHPVTMHSYNGCNRLIDPWPYYYGANCQSVLYRKKASLPLRLPQKWRIASDALDGSSKLSDNESFYCHIQGDLHLINLQWKYPGDGITWCHFFSKHWFVLYILFWTCSRMNTHVS